MKYPYGSELLVLNLATALAKLGFKVHLLTMTSNAFAKKYDQAGVTYDRIKQIPSYGKPWTFTTAVKQVQEICEEFQPDIIHSHYELTHIIGQQVAIRRRIPLIASYHTNEFSSIKDVTDRRFRWHPRNLGSLMRLNYRDYWLRRGQITFTVASEINADYAAAGLRIDRQQIRIIYNGVDIKKFGPSKWLTTQDVPEVPILTTVGRLVSDKAFDILIKALAEPELATQPLKLWLVGGGDLRDDLENLAKQYGQQDRIIFWGMKNDTADLLRQSDFYVHPARTEPFGLAVVDAMSTGLPIVISENVGMKIILQNDEGCIVPAENPSELAKMIARLINDPKLCRRQAKLLYERAQDFSIEAMTNRFVELYQEAIAGGSPIDETS